MSIELTPMRGDTPIGFMAALGLLRISPDECRLAWDPVTNIAHLHGIEANELLERLVAHMRGRHAAPEMALTEKGDVRGIDLDQYKAIIADAAPDTLDWVRCWWRQDGSEIKPTDLCLTGGPQRFFMMARKLAKALDPDQCQGGAQRVRKHFHEALFGPWLYADNITSWGWDPTAFRPGALTHEAPAKMRPEGVAGVYWLAWEGQMYFPCIPGLGTLGFQRKPRARGWSWATWACPLDRHAVKALMKRPYDAASLGGHRFESSIRMAGQYQFMMPGRVI